MKTPQTIQAVSTTSINVKDYGALGNGTGDDAPAFRAALQALEGLGGGVLWVPKGDYRLNSRHATQLSTDEFAVFFVPSNVTIEGNHSTLTLGPAFPSFSARTNWIGLPSGTKNQKIKKLVFNANGQVALTAPGFISYNCVRSLADDVLVEDCVVENSPGRNMFVTDSNKRNTFRRIICRNGGRNVPGNSNQIDCSFLYLTGSEHEVSGCSFTNDVLAVTNCGGVELHCSESVVKDCKFSNLWPAIYVGTEISGVVATRNAITHNSIDNCYGGIYFIDHTSGCSISFNRFKDNFISGAQSIYCGRSDDYGTSFAQVGLDISHNTFIESSAGSSKIQLAGLKGCRIANNSFFGGAVSINLINSLIPMRGVVISGNTFDDVANSPWFYPVGVILISGDVNAWNGAPMTDIMVSGNAFLSRLSSLTMTYPCSATADSNTTVLGPGGSITRENWIFADDNQIMGNWPTGNPWPAAAAKFLAINAPGSVAPYTAPRLPRAPSPYDANARYYCLDYDGGNDANVGYVDAPLGAVINGSAVAVKTVRRMRDVITGFGDGKIGVLLIKPRAGGATYPDVAYEEGLDLTGVYGWRDFLVRGSDLTNSADDKIILGAIQAQAGPDAGGSWTCAAGTTDFDINIASGTLSTVAGISGIHYARIRFLGNVTPSLRNVCRANWSNTSTTIKLNKTLPVTPAVGDRFVIEVPGVRFTTYQGPGHLAADWNSHQYTAGIATTSNEPFASVYIQWSAGKGNKQVAFCEARGTGENTTHFPSTSTIVDEYYWDEAQLEQRLVGFGMRAHSAGLYGFESAAIMRISHSAFFSNEYSFFAASDTIDIGKACYFKRFPRIIISGGRAEGRNDTGHVAVSVFGFNGSYQKSLHRRCYVETAADSSIQAQSISLNYLDLNGVSATGIRFRCQNGSISLDDIISSLNNNTAPIISLTTGQGNIVRIGAETANTITSTGGRVLTYEGLTLDWANLANTTWTDAGCNFYTTGSSVTDVYRKLTANTWGNLPISNGGDPAGVVDGDVWLRVIAGVPQICVRVGGVTKATAALV